MQITDTNPIGEDVKQSRLNDFFLDQLKDVYYAEQKLVKVLPKMSEAATSNELKEAFDSHLVETNGHVGRLEKAFELLGEPADAKKCRAIVGIADEGEDIIGETKKGTAQRDVGLIFAGQKAEHYEIATYGGLIQIARVLGYGDVADLLAETLKEEKAADNKLTSLAESGINVQARSEITED